MKKFFILLAASMLCFACEEASAKKVRIGDLYYNLYNNGTAEVTYKLFYNKDNYCHLSGEVIIPSSVQVKSKTYVVTDIGYGAFKYCESLTSVTIPNSVTGIGDRAFKGCICLRSVTIPNSVTSIGKEAFSGCVSFISVTIPNSVTRIGKEAFSGCKCLTSVTIPRRANVGYKAFEGCSPNLQITYEK